MRAAALLLALATASAAPAQTGARSGAPAADGDALQWRVGGRVQLDHSSFDGVYATDGRSHRATYLRRANLDTTLRWHPRWRAGAELEIDSQGELGLDSAAIEWTPRDGLALRAGRIDPDFGLEPSGSSSWTFGVERSAIWDLAPDVADALDGGALRTDAHGEGWHASAGLYDKKDHHAAVARSVVRPLVRAGALLHLGASVAVSQGWRDDGRIRSRLGVRGVTEDDAGRRSTLGRAARAPAAYDRDAVLAIEAAWQPGPWLLQAEALQRRLGGTGGAAARSAQGAYVLAAWSITGEPRRYDDKRGRFGSARPVDARRGAWETFVRLDHLDVDDGRSATVHTLGLGFTAAETWRAVLNLHRARAGDANAPGQTRGTGWSARLQAVF